MPASDPGESKLIQSTLAKSLPLLGALLANGCATPDITPQALALQLKVTDAPLVIDVRSQSEYLAGHIPGAVHVPFWNLAQMPPALVEACRRRPVVVTCEHGPRAVLAADGLRRLGCLKVHLLQGHMAGWRAAGLPLLSTQRTP